MTSRQKLNDYLKRVREAISEAKRVADYAGPEDALRDLNESLHDIRYDLQYEDEVFND